MTPNWFLIIAWKLGRTVLTLDLYLRRKIQEILVQSSINDTNQRAPEILGTTKGPHISLWTKEKGAELLLLLIGKLTRLCFASLHTSQ